ncbi:MAG TPA: hypothetical protein VG758_26675 [Hyphomicrobiaceae bacterium]|nr:hypothetical protein [Hyphomicrobiaceae bacterium]
MAKDKDDTGRRLRRLAPVQASLEGLLGAVLSKVAHSLLTLTLNFVHVTHVKLLCQYCLTYVVYRGSDQHRPRGKNPWELLNLGVFWEDCGGGIGPRKLLSLTRLPVPPLGPERTAPHNTGAVFSVKCLAAGAVAPSTDAMEHGAKA